MKRRSPAQITDDDRRLFREAIGDVQRFDPVAPAPAPGKPAPHPHMFEADEAAVPGELLDMAFDPASMEVGEELSYLRDGYPPKLLRRLKRGQFSVQDDLDLHQMNAAAAQASIIEFLAEARMAGIRCVRIIHGKGNDSSGQTTVSDNIPRKITTADGDSSCPAAPASPSPAFRGTSSNAVTTVSRLLKNTPPSTTELSIPLISRPSRQFSG